MRLLFRVGDSDNLYNFVYRDVVLGDLETAEARLDDAYAANDKEKKLRYTTCSKMYACLWFDVKW